MKGGREEGGKGREVKEGRGMVVLEGGGEEKFREEEKEVG